MFKCYSNSKADQALLFIAIHDFAAEDRQRVNN